MGAHADLLERHKSVMPSWVALYYDEPITLVRGDGRHVWDGEGNKYLDWFGGILTNMNGYNVPEVVDAIKEQASKILHTSTLYMIEPAVALAEEIARLAPMDDAKVFFTCSGTEANDAALMLATGYRKSNQLLALRNSYHGRSFAAVSVTGNRGWSASSLSPFSVSYVHGGYRYRSPFCHMSDGEFTAACVADLRNIIETTTSGDVACMIAEPIQGVGGFATPPDGFFGEMKKVLDEYGILFISDEVQTGWGRTGQHFWGIESHNMQPEIMTFAKGLGNGLTIGGVIARADIMDSLPANSISTFGGNPLSAAGALANLKFLLDNNLQSNALSVGEYIICKLRELQHEVSMIGEVRGKGLMIGIELVLPGTKDPNVEAAGKVLEACREQGLLVGKGGLYGNVIRIAPPLTMTMEEAESGFDQIAQAFVTVQENLHGVVSSKVTAVN